MSVDLRLVPESERAILEVLTNEYLKAHSEFQEPRIGPESVDDYVYFKEYWREKGRYPYFIVKEESIIGFVLVRTVFEQDDYFYQVSEFYIKPEEEGKGFGQKAIKKVWGLYPGNWELQVLKNNIRAIHFWSNCVNKYSTGSIVKKEVKSEDGGRYQYNFEVRNSL